MDLDLPPLFRGSKATVMIHRRDGRVRWLRVKLDRQGDNRFRVPFGRRDVSSVVLSLTNASTRMAKCRSGTQWSCGGRPLDDGAKSLGLVFAFQARAVR